MLEARRLKKKAEKDGMKAYLMPPHILFLDWIHAYQTGYVKSWEIGKSGRRLDMTSDERNDCL